MTPYSLSVYIVPLVLTGQRWTIRDPSTAGLPFRKKATLFAGRDTKQLGAFAHSVSFSLFTKKSFKWQEGPSKSLWGGCRKMQLLQPNGARYAIVCIRNCNPCCVYGSRFLQQEWDGFTFFTNTQGNLLVDIAPTRNSDWIYRNTGKSNWTYWKNFTRIILVVTTRNISVK